MRARQSLAGSLAIGRTYGPSDCGQMQAPGRDLEQAGGRASEFISHMQSSNERLWPKAKHFASAVWKKLRSAANCRCNTFALSPWVIFGAVLFSSAQLSSVQFSSASARATISEHRAAAAAAAVSKRRPLRVSPWRSHSGLSAACKFCFASACRVAVRLGNYAIYLFSLARSPSRGSFSPPRRSDARQQKQKQKQKQTRAARGEANIQKPTRTGVDVGGGRFPRARAATRSATAARFESALPERSGRPQPVPVCLSGALPGRQSGIGRLG